MLAITTNRGTLRRNILLFSNALYIQRQTVRERRMVSSGMLRRVALVRTDVSEETSASFIRVTKIGELGKTLAVTTNRHTLQKKYQVSE
jgi:hypothetical protein